MSPEKQRIAIAEECDLAKEVAYYKEKNGSLSIDSVIPNYLTDLNAMHEAEKTLPTANKEVYSGILTIVAGGDDSFPVINATAAQRAEAFLRTIGKWDSAK